MKALAWLFALAVIAQAHDITSQVTWSREISRLIARHCASCHGTGGTGFPLATFPQAQAHAKDILKAVLERTMPPFGAVKGFADLRDDQSLTQEQIALVVNWVQAGAPEGDLALAPKAPSHQPPAQPMPKTGAEWIGGQKKLATDMTFIGIRPNSVRGDSIRIVAERPDGTVQPLLWLYRYDPKFARTYFFRKPLRLPAGTRIVASAPDTTVALIEPAH
jgi:mono/diheme cytochrome c family protein